MGKINVQAISGLCSLEEQTLLGIAFDYMFVNITHPASDERYSAVLHVKTFTRL